MAELLSSKQLSALRERLRRHGYWRFPRLRSEIDDLTAQAVADLWTYQLRQLMNKTWPQTSIHTAIPHSQAKLRLNALNSTSSDRIQNTFARGHVGKDPTWATCSETQLDQLESQTLQDLHPCRVRSERQDRVSVPQTWTRARN